MKNGTRTAKEAPDTGASRVEGLDPATQTLLEQAGELVIDGRLVTAPEKPAAEDKDGADDHD